MLITQTDTGTLLVVSGDDSIELTADDALTLFGRLHQHLPALAAPELVWTVGWACPHCAADDGSLIEYDSHQGENEAEIDGNHLHVSQQDTTRDTMTFLCGHCRRVVGIPDEIDIDWG